MTPEQQRILEAGQRGDVNAGWVLTAMPRLLDQAQVEIDRYKQALEYIYNARTLSACKNLAGKVLQK